MLPEETIIHKNYRNAIGDSNMRVLGSFSDLPMYNFGVKVMKDMEDKDKAFLEQNIQMSLNQKEIDLEDVMAIRSLKDINQAERLLILRRQKRMKKMQDQQMQMQQAQAQQAQQTEAVKMQGRQQEIVTQTQADVQVIQAKAMADAELVKIKHQFEKEIMQMKMQIQSATQQGEMSNRKEIETQKDDRKDQRVKKQAVEQSKLISQRQGSREELQGDPSAGMMSLDLDTILTQIDV